MFNLSSNYNVRKGYLRQSEISSSSFNQSYDEPTYLTFKLDFYSSEATTDNTLYDYMPQALFSIGSQCDSIANWSPDLSSVSSFISTFDGSKLTSGNFKEDKPYSAIEYLYSRNEDTRAFLLAKFIKGWADLQDEYQFYFQSVSGLKDILSVKPEKGQKLADGTSVTIECLESIDQKVKYLLSLYRAAAWDDHYQRWILPENYRMFKMDIYISEIRTFHQSNYASALSDAITNSNISVDKTGNISTAVSSSFVSTGTGALTSSIKSKLSSNSVSGVALSVLDSICPVTRIHCDMCSFDISDPLYNDSYTINNEEQEKTTFKVNVKRSEIIYNWVPEKLKFKNLISNTERKNLPEYLDNANSASGMLSEFWTPANQDAMFNNTYYMTESDKVHEYPDYVKYDTVLGGYESSGILSYALSFNVSSLILDLVERVLASINASRDNMTEIISGIVDNATASNEYEQTALDILSKYGQTFGELSDSEQTTVQNILDSMKLTSVEGTDTSSLATTGNSELKKSLDDFGKSIISLIPSDRSTATDLDGGPADITTRMIDSSADFSINGGYVSDSSVNVVLSGTELTGGVVTEQDMTTVRTNDVSISTSMISVSDSSVRISDNMTTLSDSSVDIPSAMTSLSGNDVSLSHAMTGVSDASVILSTDMQSVCDSSVTISGDMTGLVSPAEITNGELTSLTQATPPVSTDMTTLSVSTVDIPTDMTTLADNSVVVSTDMTTPIVNTDKSETAMTALSATEYNAGDFMTSLDGSVGLTHSSMTTQQTGNPASRSDMTQLDENSVDISMQPVVMIEPAAKNETDSMVSVSQPSDFSTATSYGGETEHVSMFELIAGEKEAGASLTSVSDEATSKTADMTILPSGKINPSAKISDVLQTFSELKQKKTEIQKTELKSSEPVRKITDGSVKESGKKAKKIVL